MLVSIIIPVYNVAPFIEDCLSSVIHQTMTEGLECIIVDDCSTDNSMAIAERFLVEEGFCVRVTGTLISRQSPLVFRIIHHDHNRGLSAARNTGIEVATGDYLYFLDSDDWIIPECIECLFKYVRKNKNIDTVFGGVLDDTDQSELKKTKIPEYVDNKDDIVSMVLNLDVLRVESWNKLIKKDIFSNGCLRFKEGYIYEDVLFTLQLSHYIRSLAICKANTYYYRVNRVGSIKETFQRDKEYHYIKILRACLDNVSDYYKQKDLNYIFRELQYSISFPSNINCSFLLKEIIKKSNLFFKLIYSGYYFLPKFVRRNSIIYTCIRRLSYV